MKDVSVQLSKFYITAAIFGFHKSIKPSVESLITMNAKERYNIFDEFAIANNYHFENDCKNLIDIILNPFCKLNKGQVKAIDAAQKHYYKFMKV